MNFENQEYNIHQSEIVGSEIELKEIIDAGWIREIGDSYLLNKEDYSNLDIYTKRLLGFPNEYSGKIKLLLKGGGINIDGAKIELEFYNISNDNVISRAQGTIDKGLIKVDDEVFCPKPHHLELHDLIEIFNDPTNKTDKTTAFIQFGRVKKLKIYDDIIFDSYLDDQVIIVPEKLNLNISVDDKSEEVKINPEFEGVSSKMFSESFNRRPIVAANYKIRDDGKVKRVFVSDEDGVKSELDKIKNKSVFSGDELKDLVDNPSKYFDLELTNIEELLGERVLGLSTFIPNSIPIANQKGSEWIPGFQIEDDYVLVHDKIEYEALKNTLIYAVEDNARFIIFKGKKVRIETAKVIERIAKLIFQDKTPLTEEDLKRNDVLIVKDNIEEVEYAADFGLFKKLDSATLIKANNLKPMFKLKTHQIEGVSWLQEVKNRLKSTGALLADDMGLGKTLQILYFIESIYQSEKLKKPSLIVAPSSLLENWKREYALFFDNPSLDFVIIDKQNLSLLAKERKNPSASLYLTTYEGMRRNALNFCTVDWGIVALDEAQKIKNPTALVTHTSKGIKADFKIAMTGTPVENVLLDLWSIIDFCTPGLLGSAKGFNKGIKAGELKSEVIRDKIDPVFIRRLKSDVAKDLPDKKEHIIQEQMPQKQFDLYHHLISQLASLKEQDQLTKPALLRSIHELRLASDHPELMNDEIIDEELDFNSSAKMNIIERLLEEIKAKGEKVILFTERRKMQHLLRRFCEVKFKISPSIINGDVPSTTKINKHVKTRQTLVDEFQAINGFNIIIMSPIAAGFGLNVVGANNVIHYTRHWNPAKEQQATDRVYRIGQTKDVNIYYPMAVLPDNRKSFDEILDAKLARKKALADDLLFPTEQITITNNDLLDDLIA